MIKSISNCLHSFLVIANASNHSIFPFCCVYVIKINNYHCLLACLFVGWLVGCLVGKLDMLSVRVYGFVRINLTNIRTDEFTYNKQLTCPSVHQVYVNGPYSSILSLYNFLIHYNL